MELVIDLPHCKAEWDPIGKVLIKTMLGFVTGKEKEDLFLSGYEKMKKEGGKKWLSDNRKLRPWSEKDVEWINNVWLPMMLKAGWKYWAVIEPESVLGNLSMKNFLGFYAEQGLEVKIFHEMDEALAWMRSKN